MITIDSRRAGSGKTQSVIKKMMNSKNNIMLVVPSINLQHEIKNRLHNTPLYEKFKIINSENNNNYTGFDNTATATLNEMRNNTEIICITHQTFLNLPQNGYRHNYDLYLDEALDDVIKIHEISNLCDEWKPDLRLNELYEIDKDNISSFIKENNDDTYYIKLKKLKQPQHTYISDSETFKNITHKNYDLYITSNSWNILNNISNGTTKVITVLDPEVFNNWNNIHITAAAFENTLMYRYMIKHNIKMEEIPDKLKFIPHTGNIHIHAPPELVWSMNKVKNNEEILKSYHQYVDNHKGDNKILAVRNNITGKNSRNKTEIRLTHNVHGINQYNQYTYVSLETALIPDPKLFQFIKYNWLKDEESNNDNDSRQIIINMFAAYRFYQIIMRGKLRLHNLDMKEPFHIYLLDTITASCLSNYFDIDTTNNIHDINDLPITYKKIGRKKKYNNDEERKEARKQQQRNRRNNKKEITTQ